MLQNLLSKTVILKLVSLVVVGAFVFNSITPVYALRQKASENTPKGSEKMIDVDTLLKDLEDNEALINAQQAITYLIKQRDIDYMTAVNAKDSADLVKDVRDSKGNPYEFFTGHLATEALRNAGKSAIAVNLVSYPQLEGTMKAAMVLNSILYIEDAGSQLVYALDAAKAMRTIREVKKKLGCTIPIVVHGDHIQYSEVKQIVILKEAYDEKNGKGSFEKDFKIKDIKKARISDIDINSIDLEVLKSAEDKLKAAFVKGRKDISSTNEVLIKEGFTSIATDASTIFDDIGVKAVSDYYAQNGTDEEKLIIKLENEFRLPLEWGVKFLKLNPGSDKSKARFKEISEKVTYDMQDRGKPQDEINAWIKEMESTFGILHKEAGKNGFNYEVVLSAYDKVMEKIEQVKILGKVEEDVLVTMSENQKLLLLPASNAQETAYQLQKIDELLKQYALELVGKFGIEIEAGHIDSTAPNPRHNNKMEAKMTHPIAVDLFGDFLTDLGLYFDLFAANNGSGHGTDFDLETLTPVPQVGKISLWLSEEFVEKLIRFKAALAQHGTSGSDLKELVDLAMAGIIKFNIATNHQQMLLNILSLLDDGLKGEELLKRIETDRAALESGLHENTRAKMMKIAAGFKDGTISTEESDTDILFMKFMKGAYAYGVKKGNIKDSTTQQEIAKLLAKEFKRSLGKLDEDLVKLGKFIENHIIMMDKVAFNEAGEELNKRLEAISVNTEFNSLFVIDAEAVFEISGMTKIMKRIKQIHPKSQLVVWAQNEDEMLKLRAMGVAGIADMLILKEGIGATLATWDTKGIMVKSEQVVFIDSGAMKKAGYFDGIGTALTKNIIETAFLAKGLPRTEAIEKIEKARKKLISQI